MTAQHFWVLSETCLDPGRSSSQVHVAQVVEGLLRAGHAVTCGYLLGPPALSSAFLDDLARRYPHLAQSGRYSPDARPDFSVLYLTNLWSQQPLQAALTALDELRRFAPPFCAVYDAMDCLFRFNRGLKSPQELAALTGLEQRLHQAADRSVMISTLERSEAARVLELDPARISVLGQAFRLHEPGFERAHAQRRDLCFVGGLHPHNLAAISFFLNRIFPLLLHEWPDVCFHVIGAGSEALRFELPPPLLSRIKVLGYVEDIHAAVAAHRVQVVPLLGGSGIKGKLLQSLACGTPVVTTSRAIEGMEIGAGHDCLVEDDPAAFAAAVALLYRDQAAWLRQRDAGRRFVSDKFSANVFSAQLQQLISVLA